MDQGSAGFPRASRRRRRGHYESFYIKACQPGGGRGIWIRHTVHKRPGRRAQRLDLVRPLRPRGGGAAGDQGDGAGRGALGAGRLLDPGRRRRDRPRPRRGLGRHRRARAPPGTLTFAGDAEPCKYLPADWLYEAPLPKTKFVAPYPDARFDGRLEIDGETIELDGWPGMIGHNWGSEHAERWVWLEGTGFDDAPDTYFDAGAARIKLGPWTTPWIPSGMLMLDGEAHRLGGFGEIRSASIEESPTACEFVLPGKDIVVRGRVSAPAEGLRRLGLRRPEGPRAQHGQLLGRRPRADRRTARPAAAPAHPRRRRRLRVRHARDRPRHPDPALPGRLSLWTLPGAALLVDLGGGPPDRCSGRWSGLFGLERGFPLVPLMAYTPLRRGRRAARRRRRGRAAQLGGGRGRRAGRRSASPAAVLPRAIGGGDASTRAGARDLRRPLGQHPPRHRRPGGAGRAGRAPTTPTCSASRS